MVFPMTQEREKQNYENEVFKLHIPRMNIKSSRIHQFLHFQSLHESLQKYQNLQSKIFILGVNFLCKYQTLHRLIDLCTLIKTLDP